MNDNIKEVIVVEGRDDTAAINRAVQAVTIETHGFGINQKTWDLISTAYDKQGIIILTDPDHAGEEIRRRIKKRFPLAKEAFLDREDAKNRDDIGVENASKETILEALGKAKATRIAKEPVFTREDMIINGLEGFPDAANERHKIGKLLGIGYANSKGFLKKLNSYEISRKEFYEALQTQHNT